ncbi:MAG: hypothetical protein KJZ85_13775 [Rhodobacteraceae bacterium]|jgi:acetone carboxylase gamma subunit|nr:hypothetical protein [Paracoccaceae bacterium]
MSSTGNLAGRISPGVGVGSGGRAVCTACGHDLGPAAGPWKDHAGVREVPLAQAGGEAYDTGDDAVVLRQFHCPGCAVLLDTETAMRGDPALVDRPAAR